jgi:glutamine amidotransferase
VIVVIDYDAGNAGSIVNICAKAGGRATISAEPKEIARANKLILPGVGHFHRAMQRLRMTGLIDAMNEAVLHRQRPFLGICLGMQLMSRHSEEGDVEGFGWIDARTVRFRADSSSNLKIPHMGWNTVEVVNDDPLIAGLPHNSRFYFVHSYHLEVAREEEVILRTNYGRSFASAIRRGNICGTQFHPEKSHKFGLKLIRNFVTEEA